MKKFMNQDISGDALAQFKCEVSMIMVLILSSYSEVEMFSDATTVPSHFIRLKSC